MFITFSIYLLFVLNISCVYCDDQLKIDSPCDKGEGPGTCDLTINKNLEQNSSKIGEISQEKCSEYGQYVFEVVAPPTFEPPFNLSTCEFEEETLIKGHRKKAEAKEFPHMAILGFGETEKTRVWMCGGSLISDQFVLTVAHCVVSRHHGRVRWIRLGELNIGEETDTPHVDFLVVKSISHPSYRPPVRYNDIALLKMDRSVQFNSFIRPACLHTSSVDIIPPSKYIATEWVLQDNHEEEGNIHLENIVLEAVTQDQCYSAYKNITRNLKNGIVAESQVCARGLGRHTCQGSSGGSLLIYHPKVFCMYSLVGVTSFGKSCVDDETPRVFTRVSNYIEWIEETVWPQK